MNRFLALLFFFFTFISVTACSAVRNAQLSSLASDTTKKLGEITWSTPTYNNLNLDPWESDSMENVSIDGSALLSFDDTVNLLQQRLTAAGFEFKPEPSPEQAPGDDCNCPTEPRRDFLFTEGLRTSPKNAGSLLYLGKEKVEVRIWRDDTHETTKINLTLKGSYAFDYPGRLLMAVPTRIAMLGHSEEDIMLIAYIFLPILLPTYYLF